MKQLPRALVVSMKDNNGATIVTPLELEANNIPGRYKINRITSVFGKTNKKTGKPSNQWFIKQLEAGRLDI